MSYLILLANCFAMVIGCYLVYDQQFITGVVCFLIAFIGFRQLTVELEKKSKKKKKQLIFKPKLRKTKKVKEQPKMSVEAQIRLNKFSIN